MKPQDKILITLGSAAILAVAGFGGYALFTGGDTNVTTPNSSQVNANISPNTTAHSAASTPSAATAAASAYTDGTYTATIRYYVPDEGQNALKATITISNGTVDAVNINDTYRDRKSKQYIDSFESHISSVAEGKPVAQFSVGRVGGASLTSSAFNDALDVIRNDAKA